MFSDIYVDPSIEVPVIASAELAQRVDEGIEDIVSQVWTTFIKHLPRTRPIGEDITPYLPAIKNAYRQKITREYTCTVHDVVEQTREEFPDVMQTADIIYQYILERDLARIRRSDNLLGILESLTPDPNLPVFDYNYDTLCDVCATRIADAERRGVKPDFADDGETVAETISKQRSILTELYDALLPRTRLLRQEEYEGAKLVLDFMEGKGSRLPVRVMNRRSLLHTAWAR